MRTKDSSGGAWVGSRKLEDGAGLCEAVGELGDCNVASSAGNLSKTFSVQVKVIKGQDLRLQQSCGSSWRHPDQW